MQGNSHNTKCPKRGQDPYQISKPEAWRVEAAVEVFEDVLFRSKHRTIDFLFLRAGDEYFDNTWFARYKR
jgi:hypothetical protein